MSTLTAQTPNGLSRFGMGRRRQPGPGVVAPPGQRTEYLLWMATVSALCAAGLVMVLSASSVASLARLGTPWWYFEHQVIYLCLGLLGFFGAQLVTTDALRKLSRPLMLISLAALAAVLVVGRSAGGASRWLGAGQVQFQPSELAKLALVLFSADLLARREGKRTWAYRTTPVLVVISLLGILVMKQPDMGTVVVICCTGAAVLFHAGMPVGPMLGLGSAGSLLGYIAASSTSYREARLMSFLHPFKDASTTGYQSAQSLIALGAGHWTGSGIGQSLASWGYLPNQYTDFIFAVIGQETGLIGSAVVIALFVTIGVVGTRVALRAATTFESLLAAGITAWLVSQAVINIGAVAGALPVTGVPLPFLSYGGTSLVIVLVAAGLLANVARNSAPSRGQ